MNRKELAGFETWDALLCTLRGHGRPDREVRWVWYSAPNDRPRFVNVEKVYKNGKIRINPCNGYGSFIADIGHLDRIFVKKPLC